MASTDKQHVQQLLAAAAAACEDKKAEDIRILSLDPAESALTDYFLICTGNSDRQNVAITDEIEIRLKQNFGTYPNSVEGRRQGEWILMDYVDFIVHVFSPEKRAYYGLERLRLSATVITTEELDEELRIGIAARRKMTRRLNSKQADPKPKLGSGRSGGEPLSKTGNSKRQDSKRRAKGAVKTPSFTASPSGVRNSGSEE